MVFPHRHLQSRLILEGLTTEDTEEHRGHWGYKVLRLVLARKTSSQLALPSSQKGLLRSRPGPQRTLRTQRYPAFSSREENQFSVGASQFLERIATLPTLRVLSLNPNFLKLDSGGHGIERHWPTSTSVPFP